VPEAVTVITGAGIASGRFMFLQKSVEFTRPKTNILIDCELAADPGISMKYTGSNLSTILAGNFVNRFSLEGRSYKVIPQVARDHAAARKNAEAPSETAHDTNAG